MRIKAELFLQNEHPRLAFEWSPTSSHEDKGEKKLICAADISHILRLHCKIKKIIQIKMTEADNKCWETDGKLAADAPASLM